MDKTINVTRDVPVVAEVDVLVAGAGVAGCTAAVAAAREGAKTMLVEKFGYLGGNMGPGMFSGGVLHLTLDYPLAMVEGFKGVPGEFINRCEGYADGQMGHDYFRDHQVVAYVWARMMEESNVATMTNTFVGDTMMDGNTVTGLVVENKSGAQAVRAKVVIDATGDADVAFRAGGQMHGGETYCHPGCFFAIGDVDAPKYLEWLAQAKPSEDDVKWANDLAEKLGSWGAGHLKPFYSLFRRAWYVGEYRFLKPVGDIGVVTVDHGFYAPQHGIVGAQIGVSGKRVYSGDQALMNELETGCRIYIFETAQFMRRHVPGFEKSYLHIVSPYFHTRGGRSMVAEYVVTQEDLEKGARFDDVVFRTYGHETSKVVEGGYDFPYRQLVPKGIGGMLAAGKSAIIQPPPNRTRWKCFYMGQAAGVAAALAARDNVTPLKINVRDLQRALVQKYHFPLGEDARLKELGLT